MRLARQAGRSDLRDVDRSRVPSSPSARASVVIVGASRARPRRVTPLHRDQADEVGGVASRRETAPRRLSAARDSIRWRSRPRPAPSTARRRRRRPRAPARAIASVSTTRCSGAASLASAIASRERARDDDAAVTRQRRARRTVGGHQPRRRRARPAAASRRLGVMSTARASGSCSACAIRSAAIQSRRPARRDDQDLGRAGVEVDRAVAADERLGRRHPAVARADDLVHARHASRVPYASAATACAPPIWKKRSTPASSAAASTAGCGRGRHGDDLAHAGDARGDRGHQQRRGQRIQAARHVAADAIERDRRAARR